MAVRFESLFDNKCPVVVALHLLPFPCWGEPSSRGVDEIERFVIESVAVLVRSGVDAVIVQDQMTRADVDGAPFAAAHLTLAARAVRHAFPELPLGIIANQHGARTPLAVAKAVGAQFVRLKAYVGAMVKAGGIEQGCAFDAIRYRAQLGPEDIAIVADLFDRSGSPLGDATIEKASEWAVRAGRAEALVLTGRDFQSSLELIGRVRSRWLGRPLLLGGDATADNVGAAMQAADGVIVSTALKRVDGTAEQLRDHPWDEHAVRRFVEGCRAPGMVGRPAIERLANA